MSETLEDIEASGSFDTALDNGEWYGNEWTDNGEDDMPEDKSDLFQAWVEVRVRLDVFEDLLCSELNSINALLEDSTDVPGRAAYTRIANLIRLLESEE